MPPLTRLWQEKASSISHRLRRSKASSKKLLWDRLPSALIAKWHQIFICFTRSIKKLNSPLLLPPPLPVQPVYICWGLGHLKFAVYSLPSQHHQRPLQNCREAPLSSRPLSLQGNFRHFGLAAKKWEMQDELHSTLILNANKVK